MYDLNYMIFWKIQNYEDKKRLVIAIGRRKQERLIGVNTGDF